MKSRPEETPLPDLANCAREPIHIPGAIQPHGCLLALERHSLNVVQASANVESCIGVAHASLLGRPVTEILPAREADLLLVALTAPSLADVNPIGLHLAGRQFDAILHRSDGAVVLELEPAETAHAGLLRSGLDQALKRLARCDSFDALVDVTARTVRELTGFDRVMVYRFDSDGHGEVVAEVKADEMESYLGLHYPESDIPLQARELYRRNWVRCIPDARYTPVPLVPQLRPDTGNPLDLSSAALRSVSPVHLEYMANMGVRASMSVSLIVAGRLWGLISAGHRTPHNVPYPLRSACETIGRVVSLQIGALEAMDFRGRQEDKAHGIDKLVASMQATGGDVLEGLATETKVLMGITGGAGVAVVLGEKVMLAGSCPPESFVLELSRWVRDRPLDDGAWQTSALSIDDPKWAPWAERASGTLAVILPSQTQRCVLWFRPELTQTVNWGGNPDKAGRLETSGGVPRLHPRRSFELWKEVVQGRSASWEPAELHAAQELRRRAVEVDLERQIDRERAAVRARDDLVAVVSHDLRTPMSVVVMQAAIMQRSINEEGNESLLRFRAAALTIQRAGVRMSALLNDLLDLAKIEAGRFAVAPVRSPAGQLIGDACDLMETLADSSRIAIMREPASDLMVMADPERIFQVFSNLIGNAIKHGTQGGLVRVGAALTNGMCEFRVSDNGPGIAPEQIGSIFERYWQGKQSDSAGAGLGLYIAKGIVEAHGGSLRAHSVPGDGATFAFTLPLA